METKNVTELVHQVKLEMSALGYSPKSVTNHDANWKRLIEYMKSNGIGSYSMETGMHFLETVFGSEVLKRNPPPHMVVSCLRSMNMLSEYQRRGTIRPMGYFNKYLCPAFAEKTVKMYYESCTQEKGLSSKTADKSLTSIHKFLSVVLGRGVQEFSQLSRSDIQAFVETLSPFRKKTVYGYLSFVRCFLRYLHQQGLTPTDLSIQLPAIRRPSDNDRIPSAYSSQEIRILLEHVDRANPKGKRLYAMMLLSSLYGLRGGEVCKLRFNDIDWERNTIHVIHEKGGKDSLYPLLPAVGNAIIDYIRNARPDFDSPCIFLSAGRPVKETTTASFSDAVSELIRISGIPVPKGKRTGCHTLRHSCATMMLENDVSLPVISEVLAHTSTETTSIYTVMDATHLRQCALEVEKILKEARQ